VMLVATMAAAAGACSSDKLRDQNYGTDLAQGYRYPDGGYPIDSASHREAGTDGTRGQGGADGGTAEDAGDAGDAGVAQADGGSGSPG
jgi:hypothetical protein